MKKYRIVTDAYLGYECQVWRIWWPFWEQMGWVNTHRTIEEAKAYLKGYTGRVVWKGNIYEI